MPYLLPLTFYGVKGIALVFYHRDDLSVHCAFRISDPEHYKAYTRPTSTDAAADGRYAAKTKQPSAGPAANAESERGRLHRLRRGEVVVNAHKHCPLTA